MRVWDVPVTCLCRNHLLAEHRELHAIWNIILEDKRGYSRHPEVLRWRGRLGALGKRHEEQVREMARRGYNHHSPLGLKDVPEDHRGCRQTTFLDSVVEQRRRLREKGCECSVRVAEVVARPSWRR